MSIKRLKHIITIKTCHVPYPHSSVHRMDEHLFKADDK